MATEDDYGNESGGSAWPICVYTEQVCIFYNMARLLGGNILDTLLRFIWTAERGSRLTLQRKKDGFTLQVTGPVEVTYEELLHPSRLRSISLHVSQSKGGGRNGQTGNGRM